MRTARVARATLPWRIALLLSTLIWIPPQFVFAQTPTPAQIDAFRNLPPDQQQTVLDAISRRQDGGTARQDQQLTSPDTTVRRNPQQAGLPDIGPPRIGPRSTLVIEVELRYQFERRQAAAPPPPVPGSSTPAPAEAPPPPRPAQEIPEPDSKTLELLNSRRDRIRAGNPYVADEEGRVSFPLVPPINLTGLLDVQAAQLLNADPRLDGLHFTVTLLPVQPTGTAALKPFGYDLFNLVPTTFAPATDIPVPSDYRIGPGDNFTVELFGNKTARYQLVVGRNGALTLPEFGPMQVTGLTYDEARREIEKRVAEQMIGVRASVTMGELRSVRVFVVGDVVRPGSYTVSGLSTITNALLVSGGISEVGSLRDIQLKRAGRTVARLDLYDLLLLGDTSQDQLLQQGDAILVPPLGLTAAASGEVQRPAIYEFREGATVADLVKMAGGLSADSAQRAAKLQRIDTDGSRIVVDVDLSSAAGRAVALRSGDVMIVPRVLDEYAGGITLEGHVNRPGPYAWRPGMRLTDLLGSLEALKVNADQRYVLIRRERMPDRHIEVVSADAVAAFAARGTAADPLLESRDRVIVFSRQADRGSSMSSLLDELRLQARDNRPIPIVSVSGRVRAPGDYPFEQSMTVGDLMRAGGGMDDAAYALTAELTRYEVVNGEKRQTEVLDLDLARLSQGDAAANVTLMPYDVLVVKEVPDWREQESAEIQGEVRFPGRYPIRRGETLSSLIERAGGLTDAAFSKGSVFTREELKTQEREQVDTLTTRLQSDLALLALQSAQTKDQQAAGTLAAGQSLLQQLRGAEPKGRLVVNVDRALSSVGSEDDIQLRHGDVLMIPRFKQYVTVIGEVQNATSHVWKRSLDRDDYIAMSGGTTSRADDGREYVVRANGSVVMTSGKRWFGGADAPMEPGDTVVVPLDAERMRPLPLWTAVTTIIYNLAIAAAAVNSF
jgi:protein involved in polysaccharide export with SLBB domain